MTPRIRSYVLLVGTLALGMVLGALLVGALGHLRQGRIEGMRRDDGFVREMERIIQPRDEAQRDAIRPLLRATAARNDAIVRNFNDDLRAALEEMLLELESELDPDQVARLRRFAERPPPGPGAPGGPPGPGRRPPGKR